MVAADTAGTKIFGLVPEQVRHIAMAEKLGSGNSDLDKMRIKRIVI
jgi:hypothetical protein